jgi:hypothetical protein
VAEIGPIPRGCEICGAKFEAGGQYSSPHWDHDHGSGKGRGWLCINCNTGLGAFADNPAIIELAAKYVRERGGDISRPVLL